MISFFGCERIVRRLGSIPIVSAARMNCDAAIWL